LSLAKNLTEQRELLAFEHFLQTEIARNARQLKSILNNFGKRNVENGLQVDRFLRLASEQTYT
jgi:hypothetical protein